MDKGDTIKMVEFMGKKAEELLYQNIDQVIEAANRIADESGKEPLAKVSISYEWNPDTSAPKIKSTLAYSIRHKDEVEAIFNPAQQTIEFE